MKNILIPCLILMSILINGCGGGGVHKADISGVQLEQIKISRYGRDLFNIDPDHVGQALQELAGKYRFFLGDNYQDTLSIIQIRDYVTDPFLREIADYSNSVYTDITGIEEGLTMAFRYYLYHFPEAKIPDFYSYISGIDFEHPVQYLDTVMIIAIDNYLGKDYIPYKRMRIPVYRTRRMQGAYIIPDCMKEVARVKHLPAHAGERLLDQIIYQGKMLYFLDEVMPSVHDTLKIGYTAEQLDWCDENRSNLWAFLVENELLYSTDFQQINKLVSDGPFTSFFDKESPARTGIWVGWQIVRAYMDNNDVGLQELMSNHNAVEILTLSRFKP